MRFDSQGCNLLCGPKLLWGMSAPKHREGLCYLFVFATAAFVSSQKVFFYRKMAALRGRAVEQARVWWKKLEADPKVERDNNGINSSLSLWPRRFSQETTLRGPVWKLRGAGRLDKHPGEQDRLGNPREVVNDTRAGFSDISFRDPIDGDVRNSMRGRLSASSVGTFDKQQALFV